MRLDDLRNLFDNSVLSDNETGYGTSEYFHSKRRWSYFPNSAPTSNYVFNKAKWQNQVTYSVNENAFDIDGFTSSISIV